MNEVEMMMKAARAGDVQALQSVLTSADNPSEFVQSVNDDRETALHCAANRNIAQLLVEVVEPSKRTQFLLKTSQKDRYISHMFAKNYTALTLAVANNRTDVVEYLCSNIRADEVLETEPLPDHTPLHFAKTARIAAMLVESVPEEKRREFLLYPHGGNGYTAIHLAAYYGYDEVVEYLCGLGIGKTLTVGQDTPLHVARSRKVVELLIDSVDECSREDFLMALSWRKRTALHDIICRDTKDSPIPECPDIVRIYLNLVTEKQKILLNQDNNGHTPLHNARTAKVAELLLSLVQEKSKYVNIMNRYDRTALHLAQDDQAAELIVGCVEDKSTYVYTQDHFGNTALHGAQTSRIAAVLIGCAQNKSAYVNVLNHDGETALHNIADPETAKLLIANAEDASAYVSATDNSRQTALHKARNGEIARVLIENAQDKSAYIKQVDFYGRSALFYNSVHKPTHEVLLEDVGDREAYHEQRDNSGFTALMYYLERCMGYNGSLESHLKYIREHFGEKRFKLTLLAKDNKQRNILHLISYESQLDRFECGELTSLINSIEESDQPTLEAMLVPDIFGNTPLHYFAARFQTRVFHDICMRIPLWKRRELMDQRNKNGVHCRSMLEEQDVAVQSYMMDVFKGSVDAPYVFHKGHGVSYNPPIGNACGNNDENLYRVMKYVLNEYILSQIPTSQLKESPERTCWKNYFLFQHFNVTSRCPRDVQKKLYEMDTETNHGKPKVLVVTGYTPLQTQYLSPPGPDCLIISVTGGKPRHKESAPLSLSCLDVNDLLNQLSQTEGVQHINVNSTLSKHYGPSTKVNTDYTLVNAGCRGRALIICNKTGRDQWETEYYHAVDVLENQLGLEVTTRLNRSADEMKREIESFARSCGKNSLVALSIMSHGDEKGNICGDGESDVITVQEIVDALCQQQVEHITKLVFLSFCRGPIGRPRHNRAYESWEYTQLPQLIDFLSHGAVRQGLSDADLENVRRSHPFPSAILPLNCYILFSTLPDSKSFRHNSCTGETNWMFSSMRECLADFRKNFTPVDVFADRMEAINPPANLAEGHTSQPHVGLTFLFTEVASRVRHGSQATQVLNLCYAVSHEHKPVHVQLPPHRDN